MMEFRDFDTHSFSLSIAKEVGILEAVLFHNIYYWVKHNADNNKHFYEGRYWTFNSAVAFQKQFNYVSVNQIRTALNHLQDAGFIITGNYNKASFDRTKWYTVTDKALAIMFGGNTPNINNIPTPAESHDTVKEDKHKDEIREVIEYLNNKTGRNYRPNAESSAKFVRARLNEGFTVDDCKKVIDNQVLDWTNTKWQKYLQPSTLFGPKFENYLNAKIFKSAQQEVDSSQQVSKEEFERLKATRRAY